MQVFAVSAPGAPAEEITLPKPELQGKEVLIRVTHSGVCHSDVHLQEGAFDLGSAGELTFAAMGGKYPAVFGHEIVGTIAAAGPEATLQPGDTQYIVFPWIGCGECQACREDRENYCPRGRTSAPWTSTVALLGKCSCHMRNTSLNWATWTQRGVRPWLAPV